MQFCRWQNSPLLLNTNMHIQVLPNKRLLYFHSKALCCVSCSVLEALTLSEFYQKLTDLSQVIKRNVTLHLLLGIEISTGNSEKRAPYLASWILSSVDSSHFLSGQNYPHSWQELSSTRCRQITLFLFFFFFF